jgi:hypothetical protein
MRNYVNEAFLAQRLKWARWGGYIGFGSLIIGLFVSGNYPLIAYALLLVGLLGASFGSYMTSRYVRQPRVDKVLAEAMENLDKRYALYNYYLPSNHVIVSHYGLMVIEPRPHRGEVEYRDGRWRHRAGIGGKLMQLFGEPGLGRPDQDLAHEVARMKSWIEQAMPDVDVPVYGAVVFTDPRVMVQAEDAPVSAIKAEALFDLMRQGMRGNPLLSTAIQNELGRVLDQVVDEE